MRKKIFFLAIGFLLLCFLSIGWYLYQKPHKDVAAITPDMQMSAAELYKAYSQNEKAANEKFLNKVISIKGVVSALQKDSNAVSVQLSAGAEPGGINCSISNEQFEKKQPKAKDEIIIKGRCTGFLLDVNVVDCVIEHLTPALSKGEGAGHTKPAMRRG